MPWMMKSCNTRTLPRSTCRVIVHPCRAHSGNGTPTTRSASVPSKRTVRKQKNPKVCAQHWLELQPHLLSCLTHDIVHHASACTVCMAVMRWITRLLHGAVHSSSSCYVCDCRPDPLHVMQPWGIMPMASSPPRCCTACRSLLLWMSYESIWRRGKAPRQSAS